MIVGEKIHGSWGAFTKLEQKKTKKKKKKKQRVESRERRHALANREATLCVCVLCCCCVCVCVCVFYIAVPPLFALSVEKKKDILQLTSSPHHSTNTFPFFIVERVPLCYRVLPK